MKERNLKPFDEALTEGVNQYILKNDAKYEAINVDDVKFSKKHEKRMKKFFEELRKKIK